MITYIFIWSPEVWNNHSSIFSMSIQSFIWQYQTCDAFKHTKTSSMEQQMNSLKCSSHAYERTVDSSLLRSKRIKTNILKPWNIKLCNRRPLSRLKSRENLTCKTTEYKTNWRPHFPFLLYTNVITSSIYILHTLWVKKDNVIFR